MPRHWTVQNGSLEIDAMPFYWRLSGTPEAQQGIVGRLPIRVRIDSHHDYLKYLPSEQEWATIDLAYQQDQNIGFLNPESGQLNTYGSSVNNFFLRTVETFSPSSIYEIGCGAGYSIKHLEENGWKVTGIDPSAYSRKWSDELGFELINEFFTADTLPEKPDFIFCNDVFEHVPKVEAFSRTVCDGLADGGVFCFCTTNSTESIVVGDISMLEHQHVNMFTDHAIRSILHEAGFGDVEVSGGSYGNTFHVYAVKNRNRPAAAAAQPVTAGYLERAARNLEAFEAFYQRQGDLNAYVPLRCIPWLAAVGDLGETVLFDSNTQWRNRYIDGYGCAIAGLEDVNYREGSSFFIGSLTFYNEIKKSLLERGYSDRDIFSLGNMA